MGLYCSHYLSVLLLIFRADRKTEGGRGRSLIARSPDLIYRWTLGSSGEQIYLEMLVHFNKKSFLNQYHPIFILIDLFQIKYKCMKNLNEETRSFTKQVLMVGLVVGTPVSHSGNQCAKHKMFWWLAIQVSSSGSLVMRQVASPKSHANSCPPEWRVYWRCK